MDHKFISAKQFIEARKSDRFIYENSWKESTTAILHAPRQIDKTALAFKIASTVASATAPPSAAI